MYCIIIFYFLFIVLYCIVSHCIVLTYLMYILNNITYSSRLDICCVTCLSHYHRPTQRLHSPCHTLRQHNLLSSSLLHFPFVCLCQTTAMSYIILLSDPLFAVSNDYCPSLIFLFLFNAASPHSLQLFIHCAHLFPAEDSPFN